MFKTGPCLDAELENSRERTHSKRDEQRHTATYEEISRVYDPYDTALFQVAQERFWGDIRKHKIDRGRCEQICPGATGLLTPSPPSLPAYLHPPRNRKNVQA